MKQTTRTPRTRPIDTYEHHDKTRANNPPVGLVTPDTDPDVGQRQTYAYDPHLDPQLQWAGKAEHTSFDVPTVSLHVHERIDPRTIIEAVRRPPSPSGRGAGGEGAVQLPLFATTQENPPLRDAIDFYRHPHGWSNRLVAGDSLLVMNSLLEKEGMAGKVQMVYIDPPYGIKYGSNFQPFVNKRDVKDGSDEDLTAEPEQIRAFRDTWELGIHSYLTYLRDRLLLARELLTESGSIFVQISDENVHHVRELMDEVFGAGNFVSMIAYTTTSGFTSNTLSRAGDYLLWYARDMRRIKYHQVFVPKLSPVGNDSTKYDQIEMSDGKRRALTAEEKRGDVRIPAGSRLFRLGGIDSQGSSGEATPFEFDGATFNPPSGRHWTANYPTGMQRLRDSRRLAVMGTRLSYVRYFDDFLLQPIHNLWVDIGGSVQSRSDPKVYVVQTGTAPIERCVLMTTDPGDLVFDPTCGSGTTAYVAEQWGRRWITCDTSRVALTLAKQRLLTAVYDYYELSHPNEGVGSGFVYKTVPHITLKSIANNEPPGQETLYDKPLEDPKRTRVSGPFTVEAVPAPAVKSLDSVLGAVASGQDEQPGHETLTTDHFALSLARSGETLRQSEWRDELLRAGIRAKAGQHIRFARLEPLPGCRHLHADGETRPSAEGAATVRESGTAYMPQRIVVSFGPEHAPLEQRQVEHAWEEARTLVPRPKLLVFAAFQFDPEAAKDLDEMKPELTGMQFLKVHMNADLLTDDLRKKRASNESFWLIGQPDVGVVSEQWLVDGSGRMVMPYEFCKVLSGTDSLAKINAIGEGDLQFYAAMAQRGDLWIDLAGTPGGGVDSGKHSGRSGAPGDEGVHAVSGHRAGFVGRIGDAAALVEPHGLRDAGRRRQLLERLRRSRALTEWAAALPLSGPLSTVHYAQVTVQGFDYYNTRTGAIESGGSDHIAVWLLDTDYDGRSLYPRQVFFPMAGEKDGWARLTNTLRAEIDEDLIEAYRGTVSLPFAPGPHKRIAVKIADDRGIESLKVLEVE